MTTTDPHIPDRVPGPRRVQRTRRKPLPDMAIYVGRPTPFGNPVKIKDAGSHEEAVKWYRLWLTKTKLEGEARLIRELLPTISGYDLACWCPLDKPCHADVLLELANEWKPEQH